ncbi:thermonuclease family protein [Niallia oryzisoli]|uniref:thermonuclease family protein n=1 Tax=Niallia oryzisoli TaxID=1737571 RepID=UPI003BAF4C7E
MPESVRPEKQVQPYGKVSCSYVRGIALDGKIIRIKLDVCERDKYGHLLAYVRIDGKMFKVIQRKSQEKRVGIWRGR